MKVLHVLDTSVPDSAGYTTRGYYLVSHQKKIGIEPVVLTSERFKSKSIGMEEEIGGVKYYRSPKKESFIRKLPVISVKDEVATLYKRISEVARKEKIDIVHAHSPSLIGAACLKFCKKNKVPFIYEIRAFWEDAAVDRGAFEEGSFKYKLRRAHETTVVRNADEIIVICEGLKSDLMTRGIPEQKIHIVRNGVDCEQFKPLSPNNSLKSKLSLDGKVVLGFIGSFFNFEGLQDLIIAMKEISSRNSNVVLLLVGAGQVDDYLRTLVSKNNLQENIIFTGRVPHEEVEDYYSIIDVLVYPRIKKRITDLVTPLKPLEAMAMGKPVLMSDVGGLKELADIDGVAEFYTAGNVSELAEKSLLLCENEKLRSELGEKSRNNVMNNWGWDKRASQDVKIYEKIISL